MVWAFDGFIVVVFENPVNFLLGLGLGFDWPGWKESSDLRWDGVDSLTSVIASGMSSRDCLRAGRRLVPAISVISIWHPRSSLSFL